MTRPAVAAIRSSWSAGIGIGLAVNVAVFFLTQVGAAHSEWFERVGFWFIGVSLVLVAWIGILSVTARAWRRFGLGLLSGSALLFVSGAAFVIYLGSQLS